MTLTKETVEAGPAAKTPVPAPSQPKADLSRLRADAVSLEVPVKVHGSRVTEVVRGVTPHTEPFEEETSTMIVFPHGGVVRMATAVNVGQMLVLTNRRTSQDAICRVVKVRAYSNTQAYVEVEFTHRQAGYWGVHFPADDDETLRSAAPAPGTSQPAAPHSAVHEPVVTSVSMKVEALPKAPAPTARTESAFAQIGSKEEVQPAASQPEAKAPVAHVASPAAPIVRVAPPVQHAAPPVRVAPPPREVIEEEPIKGEFESEAPAPRSGEIFGTLTGGTSKAARRSKAVEGEVPAAVHSALRSGNWIWAAACVFFLVAGLAGGALYFRQHASGASPTAQTSAAAPATAPEQNPLPASEQPLQPSVIVQAAADPAPVVADRSGRAAQMPAQTAQNVAESQRAPSEAPIRNGKPVVTQSFAATNARPMLRQSTSNTVTAAPSVSPVASAPSAAISDMLTGSSAAPPPPEPLNRVRVGGAIVEPKLTHSTPPVFPPAAKSAGISGDVVINAHIDKAGNVGSMKIVSGQPTLQSAALAALKQWKYQPATLDGEPIETDVTVKIRFQAQ